jgi:N-acetylglutamate synthase-like GNAT family acetyltransferase
LATPGDYAGVVRLLQASDLPTDGLRSSLPDFLVAEDRGHLVGAVGLEVYGECALLRSAVVDAGCRGSGLGGDLVEGVLQRARTRGVREVYLLTTPGPRSRRPYGCRRSSVVPVRSRRSRCAGC